MPSAAKATDEVKEYILGKPASDEQDSGEDDDALEVSTKYEDNPNRIDFVFWNHVIAFRNQRVLEKEFGKPVFDRTRIILEIFKSRARSSEEKIQVELAYKQFERSRLVRTWTHLERQSKVKNIGGPGEKQLELDKRIIDQKIKIYKEKLKKIEKSRGEQRKNRLGIPMIALVGYTNVGKTTLFNLITSSKDLAEDKLFATLGPHIRKIHLEDPNKPLLVSDTVGFIRNFPASLTSAFAATLEEIKYSSLILHIRDVRMPFEERYAKIVLDSIKRVGADHVPIWTVWNKWDRELDEIAAQGEADKAREQLDRSEQGLRNESQKAVENRGQLGAGFGSEAQALVVSSKRQALRELDLQMRDKARLGEETMAMIGEKSASYREGVEGFKIAATTGFGVGDLVSRVREFLLTGIDELSSGPIALYEDQNVQNKEQRDKED